MLSVGISVFLVTALIELSVWPRRSLSSMAAGFFLIAGSAIALMLAASLIWRARHQRDLRGKSYWVAVAVGLLASLPFGRVAYSIFF